MTISINYSSFIGSDSIGDVLSDWAQGFKTAGHGLSNTGGFNSGGRAQDGEQYATHGANNSDYAFIAGSDTSNGLHYVYDPKVSAGDNMNHYLWGELDSVSLGEVLTGLDRALGRGVTLRQRGQKAAVIGTNVGLFSSGLSKYYNIINISFYHRNHINYSLLFIIWLKH